MRHMQTDYKTHYGKLLVMAFFSYASMYILMYSMVDTLSNVIPNLNQYYMAGLMTAPMIILELLLMGSMYGPKKINAAIILVSLLVLTFCFIAIRTQFAITDQQFLRSMIPHHAAAVLMVQQTDIQDPEIKKLAENILSSQQKEIDFMKSRLA